MQGQYHNSTLATKRLYSSANLAGENPMKTEAVFILLLISTTILIPVTEVPQWLWTFPFLGQKTRVVFLSDNQDPAPWCPNWTLSTITAHHQLLTVVTISSNQCSWKFCLKTCLSVYREECIYVELSSSYNNQLNSGRRKYSLKCKFALKTKFWLRFSEFKTYLLFLSTLYHEDFRW